MIHPKICCLLLLFIYFPIIFSPAALGNVRQQPSPCTLMYWMSRWSSLWVQGPLFSPAVCSRLQQEEKEEEEEEAEACFGAMLNPCTLHCPFRPSVRPSSCLPFFHRRQALVCEFSFSKPRVCLFSEIPDYIQLMFFTTSTTSSSSSATDSKLFLLLLEFFFFSNRFKTISSSSSSSSTSILLLQQQIQNYFFLNSSSSTTDSKLFLLLQQTDSKLLNSSSSAFKSNLQLFTGLPIFFKHVPNFANNFNYSKK